MLSKTLTSTPQNIQGNTIEALKKQEEEREKRHTPSFKKQEKTEKKSRTGRVRKREKQIKTLTESMRQRQREQEVIRNMKYS